MFCNSQIIGQRLINSHLATDVLPFVCSNKDLHSHSCKQQQTDKQTISVKPCNYYKKMQVEIFPSPATSICMYSNCSTQSKSIESNQHSETDQCTSQPSCQYELRLNRHSLSTQLSSEGLHKFLLYDQNQLLVSHQCAENGRK